MSPLEAEPMPLTPTPEQQAILRAVTESETSLMIQALAGCAKTTTLEMMAHALPPQPILALAFNVKIKKELEKRFPPHCRVQTLNGLGHIAWGKAIGKRCQVSDRKLGTIINEVVGRTDKEAWDQIRRLTSAAMVAGLVPSKYPHTGPIPDNEESWQRIAEDCDLDPRYADQARDVLIESIRQSFQGLISYDDQIYMSAIFNGVFPRFPLVMVDEAQDLSILNHIQLRKAAAGRLIVVGDPRQAIYQFRGADSASMDKIRALRKEWIDLPLATTFRCPKIIVERQQSHAPGFKAWHTNSPGQVIQLEKWSSADLSSPKPVAVLCRNNAPLFRLAFKLLRQRVGCYMLGRDIGRGVLTLAKKILPSDHISRDKCIAMVNAWFAEQEEALKDNPVKLDAVDDKVACLLAVLETTETSAELRVQLEALFSKDQGQIALATGHRAKGLEWWTVLHLDPWRIPSRYASTSAQIQQEYNLKYVIETRAQHTLLEADMEEFE